VAGGDRITTNTGSGRFADTLGSVEIIDPVTSTVAQAANMRQGILLHYVGLALLNDGSVFFPEGNYAELFDPSTRTVTDAGTVTRARNGARVTALQNGTVLLAGGWVSGPTNGVIVGDADVYDPVTRTFTPVSDMVTPRNQHGATLLDDGRVLFTGGANNTATTEMAATEVYQVIR
jgi:hypothetical protein